jgi:hypothetical protein
LIIYNNKNFYNLQYLRKRVNYDYKKEAF